MIVVLDGSGFSQRPIVRRTWGRKEQTPVLREHVTWKRFSALGAVGHQARRRPVRLSLSLRPQAIRADDLVSFLRSLRRHVRDPVVLVWDNLPVHRSQVVRDYLEAQRKWLTVKWPPAYAPEVNPLEDVWANVDGRKLANFVPEDMDQLERQVAQGTRRIRRHDHLVWGFLEHAQPVEASQYR